MTLIRTDAGVEELRCPLWLYQLLAVAGYKGKPPGPEDALSIEFATRCRAHAMQGRLRGVFTHIPHEVGGGRGRASEVRYALAKLMGLVPGSGDFVFTGRHGGLWLEAKRPKKTVKEHGKSDSGGVMSEDQKRFRQWCQREGVGYYVFTSADEGEHILRAAGFLEG